MTSEVAFQVELLARADEIVKARQEIKMLRKEAADLKKQYDELETSATRAFRPKSQDQAAHIRKTKSEIEASGRELARAMNEFNRMQERQQVGAPTGFESQKLRLLERQRQIAQELFSIQKLAFKGGDPGGVQGSRIQDLRLERDWNAMLLQRLDLAAKEEATSQRLAASRARAASAAAVAAAAGTGTSAETPEVIERTNRALRQRGKVFEEVADTAANSARRGRFGMFQFTSAMQDLAIVLQNGGSLDRALLGAANNFGVLFSAMGGVAAVIGTTAVIAIPSIVRALIGADAAFESLTSRVRRLSEEQLRLKNVNMDVAKTFKEIQEIREQGEQGLGSKEQVAGRGSFDQALQEIVRERFGADRNMQLTAEAFFMAREDERLASQDTQRQRELETGVLAPVRQFAHDLAERTTEASKGGPFVTGGVFGDVDKLLTAIGRRDPGDWTRFSEQVRITAWQAIRRRPGDPGPGRPGYVRPENRVGQASEYFSELVEEAVRKAATNEAARSRLPKPLQEVAKRYGELLKQAETDRQLARAEAEKRAAQQAVDVMQGRDQRGLRDILGAKEFADIAGAAERRAEVETQNKRLKVERDYNEAVEQDRRRDQLSQMRERAGGMREGLGKQTLQKEIAALEQQEQRRARDVSMDERRRNYLSEMSSLEKESINRRRAANEAIGRLDPDGAGAAGANQDERLRRGRASDATREQELLVSRSIEGQMQQLVRLQTESVTELQRLNDKIRELGGSGPVGQVGPRPSGTGGASSGRPLGATGVGI